MAEYKAASLEYVVVVIIFFRREQQQKEWEGQRMMRPRL